MNAQTQKQNEIEVNVITVEQAKADGWTPGELRVLANKLDRISKIHRLRGDDGKPVPLAIEYEANGKTRTGRVEDPHFQNFDAFKNILAARRLREVAKLLQYYK